MGILHTAGPFMVFLRDLHGNVVDFRVHSCGSFLVLYRTAVLISAKFYWYMYTSCQGFAWCFHGVPMDVRGAAKVFTVTFWWGFMLLC